MATHTKSDHGNAKLHDMWTYTLHRGKRRVRLRLFHMVGRYQLTLNHVPIFSHPELAVVANYLRKEWLHVQSHADICLDSLVTSRTRCSSCTRKKIA